MQMHEYVEQVGEQLRAAAALGDERTQHIADALAGAAGSAVRLALVAAASAVAADVSAALFDVPGAAGASVSVRLDGDELLIVVTPPVDASGPDGPSADDNDSVARISLRLSEALKADVEQAAGRDGLSINAWLVRAIAAAARGGDSRRGRADWTPPTAKGPHRISGWVTG
ncbi:MAG: hypothetical protein QOD72_610 [Acidimicrobiaceae bacterium]|nr:hypothetical protein [Acidimicrobiaceae bacterium]